MAEIGIDYLKTNQGNVALLDPLLTRLDAIEARLAAVEGALERAVRTRGDGRVLPIWTQMHTLADRVTMIERALRNLQAVEDVRRGNAPPYVASPAPIVSVTKDDLARAYPQPGDAGLMQGAQATPENYPVKPSDVLFTTTEHVTSPETQAAVDRFNAKPLDERQAALAKLLATGNYAFGGEKPDSVTVEQADAWLKTARENYERHIDWKGGLAQHADGGISTTGESKLKRTTNHVEDTLVSLDTKRESIRPARKHRWWRLGL